MDTFTKNSSQKGGDIIFTFFSLFMYIRKVFTSEKFLKFSVTHDLLLKTNGGKQILTQNPKMIEGEEFQPREKAKFSK